MGCSRCRWQLAGWLLLLVVGCVCCKPPRFRAAAQEPTLRLKVVVDGRDEDRTLWQHLPH